MNDNDLISRRRVLARKKTMYGWSSGEEEVVSVEYIESIPPAKQPMSAVEYIHLSNRMLKEDYRAWDRLVVFEENDDADKALTWAKEWAKEHPREANDVG